jgi:translation initiation factor 6 (eIF-6)
MEELLGIPLGQLTLNVICLGGIGAMLFGMLRGLIIPKSTHDRELARADQRAEDYRMLWEVANKRGDKLEEVAEDVVVIGETMGNLLRALPAPIDITPARRKREEAGT